MYSIPVNAPPYPPLAENTFPYSCPNLLALNISCETDEEKIREILDYTPFEFIMNKFVVSISDFTNCTWMPFMDVAVIIPAKFGHILGGYVAYEYEDNEAAVLAGRELWGYPKKLAKIKFVINKNQVKGTVDRKGVRLIDMNCKLIKDIKKIPQIPLYPHLLLQVLPKAEGPGVFLKRVIARDTSVVSKVTRKRFGEASISFGKLESDPIYRLLPIRSLGATLTISDFKGTWGKIIATFPT